MRGAKRRLTRLIVTKREYLALEGLFFTERTLIGYKGEGQSRNDECSKPTAVSVKTDGRTERDSLLFM